MVDGGGDTVLQHNAGHEKAMAGPNIGGVTTGYVPLIFSPTVNGEHWVEIYRSNDGRVTPLTSIAE